MTEKYRNKYRIASARMEGWDYGSNSAYFITICTKDHKSYFGHISDSIMILNSSGRLIEKHWQEIPQKFPFVELEEITIMPNHMHGIIIINKPPRVETRFIASPTALRPNQEETINPAGGITGTANPMVQENISKIIRWFKGKCAFDIRKINPEFAWQPRFHDHIIRNEPSFERIADYIRNNPENWKGDKFYQ